MQAVSTSGKGSFNIVKDDQTLAELKYKNWFASSATATLNETQIEIKPKNMWSSKFDIYKDQQDKGDIIFNWKGHIIIRLSDNQGRERSWLVRAQGFWKQTFQLSDEKDEAIMVFTPSVNWSKMNYNYGIDLVDDGLEESEIVELTLYSCYAINLYMTMMASST